MTTTFTRYIVELRLSPRARVIDSMTCQTLKAAKDIRRRAQESGWKAVRLYVERVERELVK